MRTVRGPVRAGASVSLLPTWSETVGIVVRPLWSDPPGSSDLWHRRDVSQLILPYLKLRGPLSAAS